MHSQHRCARLALLSALALMLLAAPATAMTGRRKQHEARAQFERAQQLREALTGREESKRSKHDYERVIAAYRRVYYTAPGSAKADESVRSVAELLAEEARTLRSPQLFAAAIKQYGFLRREYPGSRYRVDALFTIGQIYRADLHQQRRAKQAFQEFLKQYPHSHLAEQAQQALDDIAQPEHGDRTAKLANPNSKPLPAPIYSDSRGDPPADAVAAVSAGDKNGREAPANAVLVTGIRHWSTPDYTRIAIDLSDEVKYEAGRVPSPDRIFFDLQNAKLASELAGKTFGVSDGFLRRIRVAPYKTGTVRIVLNVADVTEYSAFLLPNPYRLIIDIHGKHSNAPVENAGLPADSPIGKTTTPPPPLTLAQAAAHEQENSPSAIARITQSVHEQKATQQPTSDPVVAKISPRDDPTARTRSPHAMIEEPDEATISATPPATIAARSAPGSSADSSTGIRAKLPLRGQGKHRVEQAASIREAQPTADGDRSLIRALGLKIGRIVVDAGHGGHDTGTIGPNGLLEKDLVLDVALRLGKLLARDLGSEVIYTRDDDTFVPLETRTAIANKEQADLFISVHANSSPDPSARGIETYYLNFTSSPGALEVAARENAVSETSIHELQDLVKKIALKEKIEESREFAADVETAMHESLTAKNPELRDRGVKKAPFIVLIGANMPSILTEISFVSNPTDERKLQTPEYRQKIAAALEKGIEKYVGGLSGIKVAAKWQAIAGQ